MITKLASPADDDDARRDAIARAYAQTEVRAAQTIQQYQGESSDVNVLVRMLREQIADGHMDRQEAMLVAQANTLDAIFNNLARRAKADMCGSNLLDPAERYMRLALKAQAQAVRTVEALGNLKNPRSISFVQQANIANGPQQVNNGVADRAGESKNLPSKLSGEVDELLQDRRAQGITSAVNPALEALGEKHGAEVGGRQSEGGPERLQGRDASRDAGVATGIERAG